MNLPVLSENRSNPALSYRNDHYKFKTADNLSAVQMTVHTDEEENHTGGEEDEVVITDEIMRVANATTEEEVLAEGFVDDGKVSCGVMNVEKV